MGKVFSEELQPQVGRHIKSYEKHACLCDLPISIGDLLDFKSLTRVIPPLENDGCSGILKVVSVCVGGISGRHISVGVTPPDWESFKQVHAHSRGLRDRRFGNYLPRLKRYTDALSQAESAYI